MIDPAMTIDTHPPPGIVPGASLPWAGLGLVSRLWAGSGDVFDWLAIPEVEFRSDWGPKVLRARAALQLLLRLERRLTPSLPQYPEAWLELLEHDVHRIAETVDYPSAHTDWTLTFSEYGRARGSFLQRVPLLSLDTQAARTLRAWADLVLEASGLCWEVLGQSPLSDRSRRSIDAAKETSFYREASDSSHLSYADLDEARSGGGIWALMADAAGSLLALFSASPRAQLEYLAPILPERDKLFELGVVGVVATSASALLEALEAGEVHWSSESPLAAVDAGAPCLALNAGQSSVRVYYQTVPPEHRPTFSTYRELGRKLGVGSLRPDIWVELKIEGHRVDVLLECKYTLRPAEVAGGIAQILAYSREFQQPAEHPLRFAVVAPDDFGDIRCDVAALFSVTTAAAVPAALTEWVAAAPIVQA